LIKSNHGHSLDKEPKEIFCSKKCHFGGCFRIENRNHKIAFKLYKQTKN
jgi:hypothetical protein